MPSPSLILWKKTKEQRNGKTEHISLGFYVPIHLLWFMVKPHLKKKKSQRESIIWLLYSNSNVIVKHFLWHFECMHLVKKINDWLSTVNNLKPWNKSKIFYFFYFGYSFVCQWYGICDYVNIGLSLFRWFEAKKRLNLHWKN